MPRCTGYTMSKQSDLTEGAEQLVDDDVLEPGGDEHHDADPD